MTHEEINAMADLMQTAREAGRQIEADWQMVGLSEGLYMDFAERVALLVARKAAEVEREAILQMLKGIDRTETEYPDGWWETSAGADFGAELLAAIRARGAEQ